MSVAMRFGPREEKEATTGAAEFLITSLFNMFPCGFLKNKNLRHEENAETYRICYDKCYISHTNIRMT
jgi:hypothetical protein